MTAKATVEELFFELVGDEGGDALAAHPGAAEAGLAYLRARHLNGEAPSEAWERTAELPAVVARIVRSGGPDAARALVALALDAGLPAARPLSDIVMGVLAPDELARALIAALEHGSEPLRKNAAELAYHTFDAAGDEYEPSPEVRARLDAAFRAW